MKRGAIRLAFRQLRYENTAFWRNPAAAFFTFAFPLMFLAIFNLLFGNDEIGDTGVSQSTFYVPAIAAFSIVNACYTNLAIGVSFSRDLGVLKRIRGTPLPWGSYLAARVGHATVVSMLLVAIVALAGTVFYDVDLPGSTLPAVLVTLAVGAASFSALGLAATAFVPNADASPAVVNATILPLLFISDVFIPQDHAPGWLKGFASVFPVGHLSESLQVAFSPFEMGSGFRWARLAVIAAWGAAGAVVAILKFSWEPRR